LIVWVEKLTGVPFMVRLFRAPVGMFIGSMACKFFAPVSTTAVILKLRVLPLNERDPKEEEFRPSSQVSICCEETIGTPRAWAEETMSGAIPG
jgi:hypothetical protein